MKDSVLQSRQTRAARGLRPVLAVAILALLVAGALPTPASAVDHAVGSAAFPGVVTAVDDSQLNAGPTSRGGNYMHDANAAWVRPVAGKVTSNYGPRPIICTPAGCSNTVHDGVDFGSACGTPIKAISPGRVVAATNAGSFGYRVTIDHGSGLESIYGHLQAGTFKVSAGDHVKAGTIIGNVGMTGVATGCHLDLKIRTGAYIDPGPFLAFRGVTL